MPPFPELPKPLPSEIVEGTAAIREAAALADDVDLSRREALNKYNDLGREDKKNEHLHRLILAGLYVVAIGCGIMFIVLVLQFSLPSNHKLLSQNDADRLVSVLFSGGIGSFLTAGAKRLTGK